MINRAVRSLDASCILLIMLVGRDPAALVDNGRPSMAYGVVLPVPKDGSDAHHVGRLISIESIAPRPGHGLLERTGIAVPDFATRQLVAMHCVRARVDRWVHKSHERLTAAQTHIPNIKDATHASASTHHLQIASDYRCTVCDGGDVCTGSGPSSAARRPWT